MHAKVVLTDKEIVLGSCNFTEASLRNLERGVLIRGLSDAELSAQHDWFMDHFNGGERFQGGVGAAVPRTPQR